MKTLRLIVPLAITALGIAPLFVLLPGCEKDANISDSGLDSYFDSHPYVSDPRQSYDTPTTIQLFSISPISATISYAGQTVLFSISSGGDTPFTWDVASGSVGSVATQPGNDRQATYTAASVGENSVIVYDKNGYSAIGSITVAAASTMYIIPVAAPIFTSIHTNGDILGLSDLNGQTVNFRVVGGVPNYGAWDTSMHTWGTVASTAADNSTAVYTVIAIASTPAGANVVSVVDSKGNVATQSVYLEYKH